MKSAFSISDVVVAASIRSRTRVRARTQLPQTPITLAAAKIASRAAAIVPRAFARLTALLAKNGTPNGAAPLRTLLPFLATIDPANARALSEQLAAYVENVVDGGESKLVALLDAYRADDAPHVVAGRAAVDTDVKTALLALARDTANAPPAQSLAVHQTLIAVTAAQIAALSSAEDDPNGLAFALPVFYYKGGLPVQMRVARDAPASNEPTDAENFDVHFSMDTAALGAISIEIVAVGRDVRVTVTAECDRHAQKIGTMLPDLRARLETLGYGIASMRAGERVPTASPSPAEGAGLDLRA